MCITCITATYQHLTKIVFAQCAIEQANQQHSSQFLTALPTVRHWIRSKRHNQEWSPQGQWCAVMLAFPHQQQHLQYQYNREGCCLFRVLLPCLRNPTQYRHNLKLHEGKKPCERHIYPITLIWNTHILFTFSSNCSWTSSCVLWIIPLSLSKRILSYSRSFSLKKR